MKILLVITGILYLFYKNMWLGMIGIPFLGPCLAKWSNEREIQLKKEFELQFRDYLQSLSTALRTGYALENAMVEARKELEKQYESDARIIQDTVRMERLLQMNVPVEQVWKEWQEALDVEVLNQFVTVFIMAKRAGGDSIEIIRRAIHKMCERMEINQDIEVLLTAKKLEFKVMSVIPLGILLYMKWSFPEFMDVLYGNLFGIIIMSICLGIYAAAYLWGRKIVDIEV